jgi:hypothetical protein
MGAPPNCQRALVFELTRPNERYATDWCAWGYGCVVAFLAKCLSVWIVIF